MPMDVIMPSLGMVGESSKLMRWRVEEGQVVHIGQILFEAESEKAIVEIESATDGVVYKLMATEGETIPDGQVVAMLLEPGEAPASILADDPMPPMAKNHSRELPGSIDLPEKDLANSRIIASPLARRKAHAAGLSLALIAGSGPRGRIVSEDVQAFIRNNAKEQEQSAAVKLPLPPLRERISQRMVASRQTTAAVTLTTEVDASGLVKIYQAFKSRGQKVTYDLLIAVIAARALMDFPQINASLTSEGIIQHQSVNIGIAVDCERGLLVPVLRNPGRRPLRELATEIEDLVERAKLGQATPEDLSGGTFTISNLGMLGIDAFTPIINLPECAILGIGRIQRRPVFLGDTVVPGYLLTLSLSFDHRLIDGAPAARFLQQVASYIENPELLLW